MEENVEKIAQIESLIDNARLDEAMQAIEDVLRQAAKPRKKRRAQQWYDEECYILRKEILEILHHQRKSVDNPSLIRTYSEKRGNYKKSLKEKKRAYWEKEVKKLVEDATNDSFIALRPRKQTRTHYIDMSEWEAHFSSILNREGLIDIPETTPQTAVEWTPLTEEEVNNAIISTKSKKSCRSRQNLQ